jgi:hypothetical protein
MRRNKQSSLLVFQDADIGPWLLRAIVRRLSHGAHGMRWADVCWDPAAGVVHCRLPRSALSAAYDLPATG